MLKSMMKRSIAGLLCMVMLLGLLPPVRANAAASGAGIWNGTATATAFEGGTGTSSNPYQIATAAQLNYLAKLLKTNSPYSNDWKNYGTKYYKLTADLDMGGYPFIGIHYFNGSFDGNNHTISGLNISSQNSGTEDSNLGLFGIFEGGTIKNLTTKGSVYSSQMSGGIVAQIRKGTVSGCTNYCTVYSGYRAGGIAGCTVPTGTISITNCKNYGMVTGGTIGGIVGKIQEQNASLTNYTTVSKCANLATVQGKSYVGGIVGFATGGAIDYCANVGSISCTSGTYAGGIVAEMESDGNAGYYAKASIQNCYNAGSVTSVNTAGGIVPRIYGNFGSNQTVKSVLKNCYNAGTVKGSTAYHVGPVANDLVQTANLYYLSTINSSAKPTTSTGLDATQMTQKSSFSGFTSSYWSVSTTADYKYPYITAIGLLPTACAHNWADATCQAPQTCTSCGTTQGSVGSHKFKNDTCSVCGLLGGSCGTNMTWTLDSAGNLVITGTGSIKDYNYGSSPFYKYADRITSVSLPDGLTSIGERAFDATFPNLDYIEIPTSVTHIQDCAFGATYNKVQLKYAGTMEQWNKIYIAEFVSYGQQYGAICSDGTIIYMGPCSGSNGLYDDVQYMLLGDGTLKITGSGAMKFYRYLNNESCFSGDDQIKKVVIDEGVTSIAGYAFKDCENLTEVYIPASVKTIDYDVFDGCTSLTDVYYGSSEKDWNQISISTTGNDPLKNATIHYTDPCLQGHTWIPADCVTPKTCSVCDAIEGDVDSTAHTFANSICTDCGAIRIDEITFPDANFRAYITSQTYGTDGVLTNAELQNVTSIDVNNKNISDLTGIQYFTALEFLSCSFNQLISLDVSGLTALEYVNCSFNQLTSLDVSGCTALTDLDCGLNQLTELDLSGLTALTDLNCYENKLTNLNVSGCTALEHLSCYDNQLTVLNMNSYTALRYLDCGFNQLTNLNVSGCTVLEYLSCSSNQLTSLDVSDYTALESLYCHNNQLTSLDVSGLAALEYLTCYGNERTVSATRNQFDLSTLSAVGFDISKASNWQDGTVNGNILTATAQEVTYTYDLGNGETETFTLVIDDFCSHTWTPADCVTPKTCSVCGETEGEALGHDWTPADCDTPKTCAVCGATEGDPLGHDWLDADCETPKTCSVCGETEGEALGHDWLDANCTTPKTCDRCGETEGEPLEHDEEIIPAVEPDCVNTGLTEGKHCTVCGAVTVPQQIVTATGHKDLDQNYTCDVCGEDLCTDHVEELIPGKDATCTETGLTAGKKCALCGDIIEPQTVIPPMGHTPVADAAVEATCTKTGLTAGAHCVVCEVTIKAQQTVPAKGHTEVTDKAVEATCTATGLTEGKHCSVCGAVTKAQQTVPAKGHTEVVDKAVAATCTTAGKTEGKHCTVCGAVTKAQQTVPAKGHTEVADKAVAATCTTAGKTEGKHCTVCGAVTKAQQTVPAKGHTEVTDKAVAATCTTAGKTEGKHCSVCGAVTKAQQSVAAVGHNWKDATCTTAKTCKTCGATSGKAKGHNWAEGNCTTPKTCKTCGAKDGGVVHAYEHKYDYKCDLCGTTRPVDMTRPMVDMFRMYDPNSGEHFYTGSMEERENLVAVGWQYEGVGFTFPLTTGKPVHRLYDPATGEHLYTMDENEMNMLLDQGWNYEGIAFNSGFENEVPQYRLHNPNATRGAYHFTASIEERDFLISVGWEYQGIGWYSLGA